MSIDALTAVVPPPARPLEVDAVDRWPLAQAALGVGLPQDYLDYALRYGSGSFGDPLWLEVWNPLSPRFITRVNAHLKALRKALRGFRPPLGGPMGLPLPFHPARPGALPLAGSLDGMKRWPDGMTLCWYTLGEAGSWPLLLVGQGGLYVQPCLGPLTSFLARLHSEPLRTLMGPVWDPGEEPRGPVRFEPRAML
jgi:hypothetical protein